MDSDKTASSVRDTKPARTHRSWTVALFGVVVAVCFFAATFVALAHSQRTLAVAEASASNKALADDKEGRPAFPTFYNTKGCPYESWFQTKPDGFLGWVVSMLYQYETAWNAAGKPTGFDRNDHNYDTTLGQGNTLGFFAGHLDVAMDIPWKLRVGLFSSPGKRYPAVARYSDFGDDSASVRLGRLALKLPYPVQAPSTECNGQTEAGGAWYGEANLLFTESLDTFPLSHFEDVRTFVGEQDSTWNSLMSKGNAIRVLARSGFRLWKDSRKGLSAKQYYTQLPFKMGCNQAGKFYLRPRQSACGTFSRPTCCVPNVKDTARATWTDNNADYIDNCPMIFDLLVQVKDLTNPDNQEIVATGGAVGWDEDYVQVATLTLPPQASANDAMGSVLTDSLRTAFGLDELNHQGSHKLLMFHPLMTAEEHRPLGETNQFRSRFYHDHAASRFQTVLGMPEVDDQAPLKMPEKLWNGENLDLAHLFGY